MACQGAALCSRLQGWARAAPGPATHPLLRPPQIRAPPLLLHSPTPGPICSGHPCPLGAHPSGQPPAGGATGSGHPCCKCPQMSPRHGLETTQQHPALSWVPAAVGGDASRRSRGDGCLAPMSLQQEGAGQRVSVAQLWARVLGACSQPGPVSVGRWPCVLLRWLWLTWRPSSCQLAGCQAVGVLVPF